MSTTPQNGNLFLGGPSYSQDEERRNAPPHLQRHVPVERGFAGQPIRISREGVRQDLQGDLAASCVSVACQTCPMPPSPMRAVTA